MKYGFIIDNRKCIGCHACTTACKSEHDVPVGVNRTWVKQVEKGSYPDTRRLFSVMRCNHCTDAPCVEICPTEALNIRPDGIVDFDKDRCIGCKSCMQACPYDALYIDPETHTAAKCNYCAHRVDIGLEPACVNVCPEHAIISGDMEDPTSEIAQLLSRQPVKVRKPEKATKPNLFYIDADDVSLISTATERSTTSLWGQQAHGVGHFSKEAEKRSFSSGDLIGELLNKNGSYVSEGKTIKAPKSISMVMDQALQVYNTPEKGILWGWEVSAYVWTKAISAGVILLLFLGWISGTLNLESNLSWWAIGLGILFLTLTGALLVMDLDQPKRFAYVLLRPHWNSWLVKGGYSITIFGGLMALLGFLKWTGSLSNIQFLMWPLLIIAVIVAVYTAFLFAQAKGRDFWQSPTMVIHMLVHSFMAGASAMYIVNAVIGDHNSDFGKLCLTVLIAGIIINLLTMLVELTLTHPTTDAKMVVHMITNGRYKNLFWGGVILVGNILPLVLLYSGNHMMAILSSLLAIIGIYLTEKIWVEAPQRISLV